MRGRLAQSGACADQGNCATFSEPGAATASIGHATALLPAQMHGRFARQIGQRSRDHARFVPAA